MERFSRPEEILFLKKELTCDTVLLAKSTDLVQISPGLYVSVHYLFTPYSKHHIMFNYIEAA